MNSGKKAPTPLGFTGYIAADDLLNSNSLALLIGMLLDQQFPIERAFIAPFRLQQRLEQTLEAKTIASLSSDAMLEIFTEKPALHRFPKSMAERTHALCVYITKYYDGNPETIWKGISDAEALKSRLLDLPGFGNKKVEIFMAVLAKRFGVAPEGWEKISGQYAEPGFHSVADLDSSEALAQLRALRDKSRKAK